MSNRRGFLKQALVLMAGATVVTPTLLRAIEHVNNYHPEVQAVLDKVSGNVVTSKEKRAISNFVLAEIENGNWDVMDALYIHQEPFLGINLKGDGKT
jgi:hypothetical protein